MHLLPTITIVTPSFNQGRFLEATIRSIVDQDYPRLEYIVMDGGSTDGSVDIIRRYADRIAYWETAKDKGQPDAIKRGFQRATGQILGFINSDDVLLPEALVTIGRFFAQRPAAHFVVGKSVLIDEQGCVFYPVLGLAPSFHSLLFWGSGAFNQPACFWTRSAVAGMDLFDSALHYAFDYELFLNLTRKRPAYRLNKYIAAFRVHQASKTCACRPAQIREHAIIQRRHGFDRYPPWFRSVAHAYYQARYFWRVGLYKTMIRTGLEKVPGLESRSAVCGSP